MFDLGDLNKIMNKTQYYFDTEFAESCGEIQLISIGIVDTHGNTFYAENSGFDIRKANPWVLENVIPKLRWYCPQGHSEPRDVIRKDNGILTHEVHASVSGIRSSLLTFLRLNKDLPHHYVEECDREFYAYYSAYDWVVLCWIFGTMVELPKGMPMFCRDLKPMLDDSSCVVISPSTNEHNALEDAKYARDLYNLIQTGVDL